MIERTYIYVVFTRDWMPCRRSKLMLEKAEPVSSDVLFDCRVYIVLAS